MIAKQLRRRSSKLASSSFASETGTAADFGCRIEEEEALFFVELAAVFVELATLFVELAALVLAAAFDEADSLLDFDLFYI